jgi:mannose-6-phosphate isomerase-like protein (cupin superfamily)
VPRLQRKGFAGPDETRRFPNGIVEIVTLDEINVSRFVFQPGWRWATDVGPIAKTETCQHRHVGYTISGRLTVRMGDGTTLTIGPGDAYEIPPGHLAWVEGDVPWESVEFTSGHSYAKSPRTSASGSWRRSSSPTSATRRRCSPASVMRNGRASSASTTSASGR